MTAVKFPSLLWGAHSPTGEIDAHVFADLNLDKLLPEDTLNILALPCPPPLISARQRIFSLLCGETDSPKRPDDDFSAKFEALGRASVELVQAHVAYTSAQNKLELLLLFRRYAKMYIKFCKQAETLDTGVESELVSGFAACFRENAEQTSHIEAALDVTSPAEAKLSEVTLTFAPEGTMLDCATPREPVIDRIRRLAGSLGYGIAPRRQQSELRTEQFYSDALLRRMPDEAAALEGFMNEFSPAFDGQVTKYRGEINFYLTMRDFYARAAKAGLPLAFPSIADRPCLKLREMGDPTLLVKGCAIIPNDAEFDEDESFFFLTGANGGGKTTFLRGVAVNLILALAGAPVFASSGDVWPFSAVYTHFPADEKFTGSGRLVEEAMRADEIISAAKRGAFVFLNETYSGTDAERGLELTLSAARALRGKGVMGLYVTHFHEVADHDFPMLNTVIDAADPSHRTFKIMKSSALRSSFARDILRKYGLDARSLERKPERKKEVRA